MFDDEVIPVQHRYYRGWRIVAMEVAKASTTNGIDCVE